VVNLIDCVGGRSREPGGEGRKVHRRGTDARWEIESNGELSGWRSFRMEFVAPVPQR
jgi:hypothetical protein